MLRYKQGLRKDVEFSANYLISLPTRVRTKLALQVRARVAEALERINKLMGADHRILTTYDSDFPHRILINASELALLFSLLADTIDYRSFKDEIFRDVEQRERYLTYHDV